MNVFDSAFKVVIGEEGGFSNNPADPGNWTSGVCGRGMCRGTRYGIAAADHPDLDIATLTLDTARSIYKEKYWSAVRGDELPAPLALLVFDAAVNCGVSRAIRWLQVAAQCATDGILGDQTIAAVSGKGAHIYSEFQAQRLSWMVSLPTWHIFGLGWARRICSLTYTSIVYGES